MLAAVLVGMIGVYAMYWRGMVTLHVRSGSIGSSVIGGLIFGLGFGVLGYCPGTVAGAVGQGALDALFGGAVGILVGSGIFAALYPALSEKVLNAGRFPADTIPELLRLDARIVVAAVAVLIVIVLAAIEYAGL
ncbi:MAG: YeeE/YedE family protein, partial [Methanomicrobiales archaeon]|nr:YeeE/YedE family protein [Methanomicrobiales archaeon]